jgi:hemin uptake protein HemP
MNHTDNKDERPAGTNQQAIGDPRERRLTILNNRLDSRDLFADSHEIVIMHGSNAYHLRLTGQNKIVLTK